MKYLIVLMLFMNVARADLIEVSGVTTQNCAYLTGVPYRNKITFNTFYIKHISHVNGRAQIATSENSYFCTRDSYEMFMKKHFDSLNKRLIGERKI